MSGPSRRPAPAASSGAGSNGSGRGLAVSTVLAGIAGSPGVAVGPAVVLMPRSVSFVKRLVRVGEIDAELDRFRAAVAAAQAELRAMADASARSRADASILEAYELMLGDELLADAVARNIRVDRQCAEWAVSNAIGDFAGTLALQADAYLRERSHDFEFVGDRLLLSLTGAGSQHQVPKLTEPSIVIAHDLSPADLLGIDHAMLLAIATEVGTKTCHTAFVARALEIPSVLGVAGLTEAVVSGDRVVVDGLRGAVTVRPSDEMVSTGVTRGQRHVALTRHLLGDAARQTDLETGEVVHLNANLEFSHEAVFAREHGAEGVGLYRTEFLFVDRAGLPGEEEQLGHYREVVQAMAGRPVVFRTFDIGGDKQSGHLGLAREPNPALGLRAVRLALAHPEVFVAQLRAIARASAHGDVRVMVPLVSSLREWREVKKLFARALDEVDRAGHPRAASIPLGMMIEVPSAAIVVDLLAPEAAFLSLGTNDLVQYTLAVDRTSPHLAGLATPFDPAVLRLVQRVVDAARAADRPVNVCGAMASDPLSAILLVGMGYRSLSMEPSAIPEIKEALHRVSLDEAVRVAKAALALPTSEEVEGLLASTFGPRLADLLHDGDVGGTSPGEP